jgi:uncharacterized integral membrane protein
MKPKMNMEFKFVFSLIFAVLVSIFAIQNADSVEVKFFFSKFYISQAVVILVSAVIGAIIAFLLGLIKQIRQNIKVKQLTKEINILKVQNEELEVRLEQLSCAKIVDEDVENGEVIGEIEEIIESEKPPV